MSNTDVEDAKGASEKFLEKGETLAATRGRLVDEMFHSALTYLKAYASRYGDGRPMARWYDLQRFWRVYAAHSVSTAQRMKSVYQEYDALFKEIKDVETIPEMMHAIAMLKELYPPNLPLDPADRFLNLARDVMEFEPTFNFPELSRHYEFIHDSLRLFAQTWHELHFRSLEFREILDMSLNASSPPVFRLYIRKTQEMVAPILEGLERFVATLNVEA